jgi:hypothetical protein
MPFGEFVRGFFGASKFGRMIRRRLGLFILGEKESANAVSQGFVLFVNRMFKAWSEEETKVLVQQLRAHRSSHKHFFAPKLIGTLAQADVVDAVDFPTILEDGAAAEYTGAGILLSNTCDAENDDYVVFAAGYSFREWAAEYPASTLPTLKDNQIYNYLYFEGVPLVGDAVFDFTTVRTISRVHLERQIAAGKIRRVASLSALGYYFFLSKLAILYLRPETKQVTRQPVGLN